MSGGVVRVAVDIVIFTLREGVLQVLLIRRGVPPFKGKWAFPGGFVEEAESLDAAALRELEEETGVSDVYLEQLYSFGDPKRDPRGRVLSISYFALLSSERELRSGTDAVDARWFPAYDAPRLAFDHRKILDYALVRLRYKLEWTTVGFELLPKKFTLTELQRVFEAVLGRKLDKRNFRRKILKLEILRALDERQRVGVQRPARLYKFSATEFEKLRGRGMIFPF
ncbi:MAG: NUDIX hydrolase [Acidobacteria bacterium]|nr:MAG: NUDIX hydrolase [Acidobacteriota bacterium]